MNILITGASGYLGGRLVNYLSQNNSNKIIAASRNKPTYPAPVQSKLINWQNDDSIAYLCQDTNVIIHLASMNEQESEADYQAALLNNGLFSLKLVEEAKKAGVHRMIYMSSIKVFGGQQFGSLDENTPARPQSSYGITHKLVEDYLLAQHLKGSIEGVVLRLSNAVGTPAMPSKNLWELIGNDFCQQAVTAGEIKLNSPGDAWRNFIAISDIEKAFDTLLAAHTNSIGEGLFNLGGAHPMRIIDLAKLVAERATLLFDKNINLNHPKNTSDIVPPTLDWKIDKLCSLGWQPGKKALINEIDNTLMFCIQYFSK